MVRPVVVHILRVGPARAVEWMQKRVGVAVEIERMNANLGAERGVEGWGCLAPGTVHIDFSEAVPGENVRAHALTELLSCEVIAYIGESDAGGNKVDAAGGGVKRRFANAIAVASCKHAGGPERLGRAHVDVRVVADAVAHRLIEQTGLLAVAGVRRNGGAGEIPDGRMITIDIFAGIGVDASDSVGKNVGHAAT